RRRLLLQRLRKLARACLHLIEQPHVLDRDHRLVGEGCYQLDLLFGKGLYSLAPESDHADRHILPQERHAQRSSSLSEAGRFRYGVFWVGGYVLDVDDPAFEGNAAGDSPTAWRNRHILEECLVLGRESKVGRQPIDLPFATQNQGHFGVAEMRGGLDERVENGLQLGNRAADDLEHVGGGGLLLQRFPQLVEQARILDRDHRLGSEVRHQLNLLGSERPHLLAVDANRAEQDIFLEHRHAEHRPSAREIGESDDPWIAFEIWRHRSDVVDLHDFLGSANLGMTAFGMNAVWHVLGRGEGGRYVVYRGNTG